LSQKSSEDNCISFFLYFHLFTWNLGCKRWPEERATSPAKHRPLDRTAQATPQITFISTVQMVLLLFTHQPEGELLRVHEKCTQKIKVGLFSFQKIPK
jgi:hypothetical protein